MEIKKLYFLDVFIFYCVDGLHEKYISFNPVVTAFKSGATEHLGLVIINLALV